MGEYVAIARNRNLETRDIIAPTRLAVIKSLMQIEPMIAPRPILIAGPTASGKSALALNLSEQLDGVIINADALQVYSLWRVLTARPSPEDEARAPHALYGHVDPSVPYSVGAWLRDLEPVLQQATADGKTPIIIGGTGLYFAALTEGLAEIPEIPEDIRTRGNDLRANDPDAFSVLKQKDPEIWARIDRKNPARLQRAWEVLEATGKPLSQWQAETPPPLIAPSSALPFCLNADSHWLGERIDLRFDMMLEQGAITECGEWIDRGLPTDLPAAKALGAPEIISHLHGELSLDAARTRATIATRQFAKRQRTWFRSKMSHWKALDITALGADAATQNISEATRSFT